MRVPSFARNALFALGMGLLTTNYVHAAAAALAPAAGQAIATTSAGSVMTGVVRGGYVLGTASLYIAEFGGAVTLNVAARVAAGAALAAAGIAAVGPLVVGGFALGAGAAAVKDWLDDAHAAGVATDYEVDPQSGKLQKKGTGDDQWRGDIPIPADVASGAGLSPGASVRDYALAVIHPGLGPFSYSGQVAQCTHRSGGFGNYEVSIQDRYGGGQDALCTGVWGSPPPVAPPSTLPAAPTANEWEALAQQLAAIPLNPRLLENYGKPIPVDPVPVINPPDQTGVPDVEIGATNPAPTLESRPHTVNGTATPINGTVPQQYTQPIWTIAPANTAAAPYAVNLTVVNNITVNPAVPTNPSTPGTGTATPSTPDVCAQNPNSVMCQPPGVISDPDMPPIPELYTRKYPDGLAGIWQSKSEAIKQASLFTLASQLMPTGVVGGTCPSWSISLNLGPSWAQMGVHEIAPPCWIWDVCKAIIIVSALMLARRLIFGG